MDKKGGGGAATDISHRRRDANLDARVSFLGQLALEEFVQFGVKDTVGYELPTLGNGGSWYRSHDVCGCCEGILEVDRAALSVIVY